MSESNVHAPARKTNFKSRRTHHGMTGTPEHQAWSNIIGRCFNPNLPLFNQWGGRGITMCERWRSFANFFADVGTRPSENHSIDRIDNDKGYEPGNVRWTNRRTQQQNTRRNRYLTINGETLCIREWSRRSGVYWTVIKGRADRGISGDALLDPVAKRDPHLRGVYYSKHMGKWQARFPGRRPKHIGTFDSMEEALAARSAALGIEPEMFGCRS